jgi:hypothetical protein
MFASVCKGHHKNCTITSSTTSGTSADDTVTSETAERKCKSLGIAIEEDDNYGDDYIGQQKQCPQCTRVFDSRTELHHHYYGNAVVVGCCQVLIRRKQLEAINTILHYHVVTQTDQLLEIVTSSVGGGDDRRRPPTDNQYENVMEVQHLPLNQEQKRIFTWKDVLKFLRAALDKASSIHASPTENNPSHPVLETLRTSHDNGINPLVLNPMIIEVINRRLIDRYANVSR